MTGWIVFGIYAAGFVWTARMVTRIADAEADAKQEEWEAEMRGSSYRSRVKFNDTEARIMNRGLGIAVALIWPVVALGALITGRIPKSDAALRMELAERERHIEQLEKELGVSR